MASSMHCSFEPNKGSVKQREGVSMLDFIGCGSAFNTPLGNNSAFIRRGKSLFLIDCGGSVFPRLQELGLLEDIENLYIAITHTHPDHVGSLGDLIFYSYYILRKKPLVLFPEGELLAGLLSAIGVLSEMYCLECAKEERWQSQDIGNLEIVFHSVVHVDAIPAYGMVVRYNEGAFYYSGDAHEISPKVVAMLRAGEIKRVYHDTSGLDVAGNPHMSLIKLEHAFEPCLRDKVFCMHLDSYIRAPEVYSKGFQVVERYNFRQESRVKGR